MKGTRAVAGYYDIDTAGDVEPTVLAVRDAAGTPAGVLAAVGEIIDNVRARGDDALLEYTRSFDGVEIDGGSLEVDEDDRRKAWSRLDHEPAAALEEAAGRVARFSRSAIEGGWEREVAPGVTVGWMRIPMRSAGLYVPGGRYAYPSTVLMTGVPAREAGVKSLVFCTPPGPDGSVNEITLAATWLVGDCRVFRVGGAQAIAAMAMGTESVPACDIIAGPGNAYVAAAKRMLAREVAVDLDAGPSEIAVYIDDSGDPAFAAADVLAQSEHDPMACAVLVSESAESLERASSVIAGMSDGLRAGSPGINLVRCASRELSVRFLNALAPEHLTLMVEGADAVLEEITSAGCVFIGPYSAVALGDYIAGPSHVLPTGGSAARLSGLGSSDFTRTMNVIRYTKEGFERDAPYARLLAGLEGLTRHMISLDVRSRC